MAKRKRLEMPDEPFPAGLETKSAFPPRSHAPIAAVAGETAARAALDEVSRTLGEAEREGRLVKRLPLGQIEIHHLTRDRLMLDEAEMEALTESIRARGQQTPVEVLQLSGGQFGLISGMRRIEALRRLGEGEALAIVRRPDSSEAAYVAMIEENEIRAGLSFYERANVVSAAVTMGLYSTPLLAVQALFPRAPAPKRSKILAFVTLREKLGTVLRFPAAIPEKLGLALVAALEADGGLSDRIAEAIAVAEPADSQAERRVLDAALKRPARPKAGPEEIAPGVALEARKGRALLKGRGVDAALLDDLRAWLSSR
jgi:ParB family chromosome partitioning protein